MSAPPCLIQIPRPASPSLVQNDLHILGLSRRRHVRRKPKLQRKIHVSVRQIGRSYELVPRPPRQTADDRQNDDREGTGNSSCRRGDRNSKRRRTRRLGGRRSRKRRATPNPMGAPRGPMLKKAPIATPPSRSGPANAITRNARPNHPASMPTTPERKPRTIRMTWTLRREAQRRLR